VQIVELTKQVAADLLASDPNLARVENQPLRELKARYASREERDFSMIS
jgi:ATP-dependent DNA helicase RecG